MSDTLDALYRAVVASPEDHTVRLVYADALDESGEKADAARAEFIRRQIELAGPLASADPRCHELFEEFWVDWWRPVCERAGWPVPLVPGSRIRDRVARALGTNPRPKNWPYAHLAESLSISLPDYQVSVAFTAGFPEAIRFETLDTPADAPVLLHTWGNAIPLQRLTFAHRVTPLEWQRIEGSHLERLAELTFEQLMPDTSLLLASCPHLAEVTRLRVDPIGANSDAISLMVRSPVWTRLQSLHFTGWLSPTAVRDLATQCNLEHLEELHLMLGNPAEFGAMGQLIAGVVRMATQLFAFPGGAQVTQWSDFGPALEALAAAPWLRKLRRLRIGTGHPHGLLGVLGERLYGSAERGADLIPDRAIYALADALDLKVLERLTLPATVISPTVRETLTTRLDTRVGFV